MRNSEQFRIGVQQFMKGLKLNLEMHLILENNDTDAILHREVVYIIQTRTLCVCSCITRWLLLAGLSSVKRESLCLRKSRREVCHEREGDEAKGDCGESWNRRECRRPCTM